MIPTIEVPKTTDLTEQNREWTDKARSCLVTTQPEAEVANALLRDVKGLQKAIKERFEPAVAAANKAHKELTTLRASLLQPLDDAEGIIKRRLGDFMLEERRKADAERRRLEEEARRKEEDDRLAEAASLERQGRTMEAQAVVDAPIVAPPVIAPPAPPKIAGTIVREVWTGRVDNLLALVRYVAENPAYVNLLRADQAAIDALARAAKGDLKLAGVSAHCDSQVSVR